MPALMPQKIPQPKWPDFRNSNQRARPRHGRERTPNRALSTNSAKQTWPWNSSEFYNSKPRHTPWGPPLHHRMFTMLRLFVLGSGRFFIMALSKISPRFRDRLGHIIINLKWKYLMRRIAICDDVASKVYKKCPIFIFLIFRIVNTFDFLLFIL